MLYKFSCIFNSLTFGVDMKYMSMLDILEANLLCFSRSFGCSKKKEQNKKRTKKNAFYFCLLVCFSAFVVCIFSDEDQGRSTFQEKTICLHAMNAKRILYINIYMKKYSIIVSCSEVTSKRGINNIHMVFYVMVQNAK